MQLTPLQLDTLAELINIGVGRAAGMLNQMTATHVQLDVPEIRCLEPDKVLESVEFSSRERISAVRLAFGGAFSGTAALVFPPESAAELVRILVGDDGFGLDMDTLRVGTLQEVGNIVLNGVMGSIGNLLNEHISYVPPEYFEDSLGNLFNLGPESVVVVLLVRTRFQLEERQIEGDIIIFFKLGAFGALLDAIDNLLAEMQG